MTKSLRHCCLNSSAERVDLMQTALTGRKDVYSVRIGVHYRALELLKQNTIYWFWIGTHAEYDRLT